MVILWGILNLLILCSSILILSSIPISLYPKKSLENNKAHTKDYYSLLFDVYGENTNNK
ncbi:hypothetical protein [Bacillus sp. J33]|uniref:hypothetical protein n=1 Tax=Bacillus sp. J33 TaxID=935836 RepID=UPI0004B3A65E|nr:hypothetical protein [Bacillus sp. J33]